jgi:proton-translocating NADH-quinone oxidoreductase chain M
MGYDLFSFYFWFEASLIPMLLIIFSWGSSIRRLNAGMYLLFYTVFFSIPFLIAIVYIHKTYGTTSLLALSHDIYIPFKIQQILWLSFFLAFAVKVPLFPFHIWLPEAHVEAPTVGSILLAGIMLKVGYYSFVRFVYAMLPLAVDYFRTFFTIICLISAVYSALIALSQIDFKKIIAYSSVSHMGFCLLGLNCNNIYGFIGSFLLSIGHTFVSSALFLIIGILYERFHERTLTYFSGLSILLPNISGIFFFFFFSNFGFPFSLNFVAELFIFFGIVHYNLLIFLIIFFYSTLNAAYNLYTYIRLFHGSFKSGPYNSDLHYLDIQKIELYTLLPLIFCNFIYCYFPSKLIRLVIIFYFIWLNNN